MLENYNQFQSNQHIQYIAKYYQSIMQNNSIKKSVLRYVQCPAGGLHCGQVMNLVCVDSKCNRRGLICPICRMETHQSHQILPIKTFLENIRSLFVQSDNQEQLNNLSDYLRALDVAKKQILNNLRADVEKLAKSFKELQQKIEQHFVSVRKNVLIQSTITTKLPTLLTLLSEQQIHKDSQYLQQQFKKYTELLKYQNQKLIISDKAKTIVQSYGSIPQRVNSALENDLNDFMKKLNVIPRFFEQKQSKTAKNTQILSNFIYSFSSQNKYFDILLQEDNKLAKTTQQCQEFGYVFVAQNKGALTQKIILQIVANNSDQIRVGLGDSTLFANSIYASDGTIQENIKGFNYIVSNGYNKEIDKNYDSQDSVQLQKTQFVFRQGDILQIQFIQNQMRFLNKTSNQKYTSKTSFSEQCLSNVQFVVGLSQGDSVRILNE